MSDLVAFLRARLDERAAKAQAAMHGGEGRWKQEDADLRPGLIVDERGEVVTYDESSPTAEQAAHIEDNDPAWVLRDVASKRRIIARCETERSSVYSYYTDDLVENTLIDLALPYAAHPDYPQEWKL